MAKYKKMIFLFLALLFPVCIFLFLKFFGKNEFAVQPLYTEVYPENMTGCGVTVALPYRVPDSVKASLDLSKELMSLIHFGPLSAEAKKSLEKVMADENRIELKLIPDSLSQLKNCIFFLKDPNDLVLVDSGGTIMGQYISDDRDEIDRLRTELSIIFKDYQ